MTTKEQVLMSVGCSERRRPILKTAVGARIRSESVTVSISAMRPSPTLLRESLGQQQAFDRSSLVWRSIADLAVWTPDDWACAEKRAAHWRANHKTMDGYPYDQHPRDYCIEHGL